MGLRALLLLLVLFSSGCQAPTPNEKAKELMGLGDYDAALSVLEGEDGPTPSYLRGRALLALSKYRLAHSEFESSFRQAPADEAGSYARKIADAYVDEMARMLDTKDIARFEQLTHLLEFAIGFAESVDLGDYFASQMMTTVQRAAESFDNPLAQRMADNLAAGRTIGESKRTMADLRSIGTAIESYSIDYDQYPAATDVESLAGLLEPTYIRTLPRTDAWGREFQIDSRAATYRACSGGKDHEPCLSNQARGGLSHSGEPIIFENGQFVQWPSW